MRVNELLYNVYFGKIQKNNCFPWTYRMSQTPIIKLGAAVCIWLAAWHLVSSRERTPPHPLTGQCQYKKCCPAISVTVILVSDAVPLRLWWVQLAVYIMTNQHVRCSVFEAISIGGWFSLAGQWPPPLHMAMCLRLFHTSHTEDLNPAHKLCSTGEDQDVCQQESSICLYVWSSVINVTSYKDTSLFGCLWLLTVMHFNMGSIHLVPHITSPLSKKTGCLIQYLQNSFL